MIMTHDHFDHDAIHRITGLPTVVRHAVEMRLQDLLVTGYADWHVPGHSSAGLANVIFVLESGGVRVCHLGDNRWPPPEEIVEAIGEVDVIIVPVDDSCHLLSYEEVDAFIDLFAPRIVIPVHYFIPGSNDARIDAGAARRLAGAPWQCPADRSGPDHAGTRYHPCRT